MKKSNVDNSKNIEKFIFLCNNQECTCKEILNDPKKIDEIITKQEKYYCFKHYMSIIRK